MSRPIVVGTLALVVMLAMEAPASAADPVLRTTWPTIHADAANSDYVPLAGPVEVTPKWSALQVRPASQVTIGPEGKLYTVTMDAGPCHLYSLGADGSVHWCSDQVRAAFTTPTVGPDGAVYVSDGVEVFRFEPNGGIAWRVPATAPSVAVSVTQDGLLLVIDHFALATVYARDSGAVLAQLAIPAGVIPRPDPLPFQITAFTAGASLVGFDPQFVDSFADAFFGYEVAVGNNAPALDASGRIFIAVAANQDATAGVFYGIDLVPEYGERDEGTGARPVTGARLELACSAAIGLSSASSPALSADGLRVYLGDETGLLRALRAADCSAAWELELEAASFASPTVGPDGTLYMLVSGRMMAFRDDGDKAQIRWQVDIAPYAQSLGYATGRFNSVIAHSANSLYAAASFFQLVGSAAIPVAHALVTVSPDNGSLLSAANLGEESATAVSLGPDGMIYVASKPIAKAVFLGVPQLRAYVPPAMSGIFAFEPASYRALTLDGLEAAWHFVDRGRDARNPATPTTIAKELERAVQQYLAVQESYRTALARAEINGVEEAEIDVALEELRRAIDTLEQELRQLTDPAD